MLTNRSMLDASIHISLFLLLVLLSINTDCQNATQKQTLPARSLKEIPAARLSYSLDADQAPPSGVEQETRGKLASIQSDFDTRRKQEALVLTVASPDGQRALALFETADDNEGGFRIDMYSSDGKFLRNLLPPELSGAFPETVAWSPDGSQITFIARKSQKATQTPAPPDSVLPEGPAISASPSASVAPIFAAVPAFNTEQVYICNRDGYDLRPLTTRDGLIYFSAAWAPDGHAIASLACKEDEWDAREKEFRLPAGRPRLIGIDGKERLIDDELTDAPPIWSPDSSKVATAFETDVAIYDAGAEELTGARIPLREPLMRASVAYDEKNLQQKIDSAAKTDVKAAVKKAEKTPTPVSAARTPASFNPIVLLEWPADETLFIKTAYVRTFPNDPVTNFQRWHELHLGARSPPS